MNALPRLFVVSLLTASFLAIPAALLGPTSAIGAPTASDANSDTLCLGPEPHGSLAAIATTADHRHFALVGANGSRMSAYLDGQPGEKYDQILTDPPVISADGKRIAYAARKGSQFFMVVDGKEYGPYDSLSFILSAHLSGVHPAPFQATPNWPTSPSLAPTASISRLSRPLANQSVVVEDGTVISGQNATYPTAFLLFSKQGDHLLFVARSGGKAWVVLDGISGPKYTEVYHPQFSSDSHHLEYAVLTASNKVAVVFDGKEGPEFDRIGSDGHGSGIQISSDNAHVVYTAGENGPGQPTYNVVIDGKSIPNADRVWMTADGKTIAYLSEPVAAGGPKIVANGKVGLEYAGFQALCFAPDGHAIYAMRAQNGKSFVIDGDQESDGYDSVDLTSIKFSDDGKHMAYVASADDKSFVVLDGKHMPAFGGFVRPPVQSGPTPDNTLLQLTPSGHVFYHAGNYGNSKLVEDDRVLADDGMASSDGLHIATVKLTNPGTGNSTAQVTFGGVTGPTFYAVTKMAFSPDGKHFAYVGARPVPNGNDGGYFLVVDGVQKGEYSEVSDLQFSPDSQHLFHFTTSHLAGGGKAFMDQANFATFAWLPGYWNTWLDDNRTMQVVCGKDDKMTYRARYFLPGASRSQVTAQATGTGAVDMQETHQMIGNGAAADAAPVSSTAPGNASATGNSPASSPQQQAALAPGTTVEVKMVDLADSDVATAGQTFRATVISDVSSDGGTVNQGSAATVTLGKDGNSWLAKLTAVTVGGNAVTVTSSSVTVTSPTHSATNTAANVVGSIFGHKPKVAPAVTGGHSDR